MMFMLVMIEGSEGVGFAVDYAAGALDTSYQDDRCRHIKCKPYTRTCDRSLLKAVLYT